MISKTFTEVSKQTLFSISPNPSNSVVYLTKLTDFNADNFVIYDVTSKKVKVEKLSREHANYKIDISDLLPGIYLCSFEGDNIKTKTVKLTVIR